ncbi:tRNA (adenosine(37)-N6)-dimethylallyltransferase MiaA [Candidatus Curtissbacteria bacterium RBG_13_35_7]|uniref:tRNA dimethylallyltransferase n=1 Tax=Candidatus Curtissbacteria bacterium RBG_13_35_7 TaxID=1797705 RepID=A0A1F5G1F2_9BACT|nr:MAG: tRNA (adenosine(37)-N6)-dimethylallyltransferase MiaA [Candidatus Curtissbacteria bacterium RBG_13_35_7]
MLEGFDFNKNIYIIYGPTVTGKTDLALHLAKKFNGELISADSRQVYKGLDIGSGKLSIEQLNDSTIKRLSNIWIVDGIKIHGFDLVSPGIQFTVADFVKFANTAMIQIINRNKQPIIVGGTAFYIKSILDGIDTLGIPKDLKLRKKLEKLSVQDLYRKLLKVDINRAQKMNESDRANPRRLIRAIEITIYNKKQEIRNKKQAATIYNLKPKTYNLICLSAPNPYLYKRADYWLEERLKKGLIEEVKRLLDKKVDSIWLNNLGLEYRWITRFCLGNISQQQATDRLKGDIHNLIRKQKTWFTKFEKKRIFDISKKNWQEGIEKILQDCTII